MTLLSIRPRAIVLGWPGAVPLSRIGRGYVTEIAVLTVKLNVHVHIHGTRMALILVSLVHANENKVVDKGDPDFPRILDTQMISGCALHLEGKSRTSSSYLTLRYSYGLRLLEAGEWWKILRKRPDSLNLAVPKQHYQDGWQILCTPAI